MTDILAEMRAVRDVRDVPFPVRRIRPRFLWLMFLLGLICTIVLVVAALSIFDIHATISWPAGRIEVGRNEAPHVVILDQPAKEGFPGR